MNLEISLWNKNHLFINNIISWTFAITVMAVGIINIFWGNDADFGFFLLLLSLVYFPPINVIFKEKTGLSIRRITKILLGIFIIWASLGVGELFDKIDLMMIDLQ